MSGHHPAHDHDHDHDGRCLPSLGEMRSYFDHGIRFNYPADWTLTEQSSDDETTVTVQSEGTSFWTLMLLKSRPDPESVLETIVQVFEQDYDDLDVATSIDNLAGVPAIGRDLDFVCYDLVNSATVRAFQGIDQTVMILYQATDHELQTTRNQLKAISASLTCEDDQF